MYGFRKLIQWFSKILFEWFLTTSIWLCKSFGYIGLSFRMSERRFMFWARNKVKEIDNINEIKILFRRLNKRTLVFKDQIGNFFREMLTSALRALVKNPIEEIFYGKRKKNN